MDKHENTLPRHLLWVTQYLKNKREYLFVEGEVMYTWNTDIINYSALIPSENEEGAWLFVAHTNSPSFFPNGKFGFKADSLLFSFYFPPTHHQFNALMDILDIP